MFENLENTIVDDKKHFSTSFKWKLCKKFTFPKFSER